MGVYAVSARTGEVEQAFHRSLRVMLFTDCASGEEAPAAIRSAADDVSPGDLAVLRDGVLGASAEAALIWLQGERLLEGSPASIRHIVLAPRTRALVPVHLPCLAELDLIGLQPRAMSANPQTDVIDGGFRMAGVVSPSPKALAALIENTEAWSRLYLALLTAQQSVERGIELLGAMWRQKDWHPSLRALALRNLAVLTLRQGQTAQAEELLQSGVNTYPDYADLRYVMALVRVGQRRYDECTALVETLKQHASPLYVGSGGETTYRANYILGMLAECVGKQDVAFMFYLAGLRCLPAHEPSVAGFLRQRLPNELVGQVRPVLFSLVQKEPKYFEPVFYFLLLHRQVAAARRLLAVVQLEPTQREVMTGKLEDVVRRHDARGRVVAQKPGVILTGPFFMVSSVARINRALAKALLAAGDLDVALEPHGCGAARPEAFSDHATIKTALARHVRGLGLTIRHHWPPRFDRPSSGKLALIVHWEFGGVPRKWVEQINRNVDELWVLSQFVRKVFVDGGANPERVHVIPAGIDTDVFAPAGERWRPEGCRRFMFLFVGGAIERKGADVLAAAYRRAFSRSDDVTLVIKEIGSNTFYRHNTLTAGLQKLAAERDGPHMIVLTDEMRDARLAALYRACDVFVLPYRGEGFGMPIAEAMACGKPVITTGLGPARDFCAEETAYFVPARVVPVRGEPPPFGELAETYTWFEPDLDALAVQMRYVYEHAEEASRRGQLASLRIRESHNWRHITPQYLNRVRQVLQQ